MIARKANAPASVARKGRGSVDQRRISQWAPPRICYRAGYDGNQRESIKSPSGREAFGLGDHAQVTGYTEVGDQSSRIPSEPLTGRQRQSCDSPQSPPAPAKLGRLGIDVPGHSYAFHSRYNLPRRLPLTVPDTGSITGQTVSHYRVLERVQTSENVRGSLSRSRSYSELSADDGRFHECGAERRRTMIES
jgi:hypothetical protein